MGCWASSVAFKPQAQTRPTVERILYDRNSAAEQLSISVRSLAYFLSRGEIRFRKIGAKVLIPRSELIRFAKEHHPYPVGGRG